MGLADNRGCWIVFADKTVLELDATFSQAHDRDATITQHPVERGADVTDHIRPEAKRLGLTAVVSFANITPDQTAPDANRHVKAFHRLQKAWLESELLEVHTGVDIYKSMGIARFSSPREGTSFDVNVQLELREVRFVTAQTTRVPRASQGTGVTKPQTRQQAPGSVHHGQLPTTVPTAPQLSLAQGTLLAARGKAVLGL